MIPLKKMLVAFDGSPSACKAFDFALELASGCGGEPREIVVLSVVQPPEPSDLVEMDAVIDAGTEHFRELFGKLQAKAMHAGVPVTTEVAVGHPADQVVRYAAETGCDMVIVGQRGRSLMERWLLGSVSKRIASYAPCTVVIVK